MPYDIRSAMIFAPSEPRRYARPTAAWKARITPERSRVQHNARPQSKRPHRLLFIRPQEPNRPCYFSLLPRELRLQVYGYIMPQDLVLAPASRQYICAMKQRFKPALLHVCGLLRLEIAALLYGSAHITYMISSFDFRPLEEWLTTLPVEHVAYLARNKNLTIDCCGVFFQPVVKETIKLCERFGNRYSASSKS